MFLALGNYTEAQQVLQAALQADSNHVPALFAAAQLLLASAKYRIVQGTPGDRTCLAILPFVVRMLCVCLSATPGFLHLFTPPSVASDLCT